MVVNAGIGPGCDGPPKAALRRRFRARRRALSATLHARHAEALARALLPRLSAADVVAIYLRQDGEIDPAPLLRMGLDRGVAFALPVLAEDGLRFARYRADEALTPGRHGLLEPANPVAARPTLVLAPVVAFDQRGYRLGMGGGHYDRYFAAHPDVRRIGVAHACQEAACLPVDPWDVALSAVATECGLRRFAGRGGNWLAA